MKIKEEKKLNTEQREAVEHDKGPAMIVAGAGTGKTTVITERIAWLINSGRIKADEVLALTFTDKAAGEMEERVDRLLPYGYVDLWIMTFHAFAERIVRAHGIDIGIPNDFRLLNQTEQWMLIRDNIDRFELDYYRPLGNPTKFIHALIKHFSCSKDEDISPVDYIQYADDLRVNLDSAESGVRAKNKNDENNEVDVSEISRINEVANAYQTYQKILLENEAMDFGDLIVYALRILRERPRILERYKKQFKYILVDEFQDTNWAQYEIVKTLAGEYPNLMVVGDDDQSIYRFRGASVSNILQFKKDYPKAREIYLRENYRSSQEILDLSYDFIQLNNPERLEIKLRQQNKDDKLSKQLIANTKEKGRVEYKVLENEAGEVEYVVNKIIDLKNADDKLRWDDFAILVRANSQAVAFTTGLDLAGVPYLLFAQKGLYKQDIVQDILAYLELLDNYHESRALWRVLNFDVLDISKEDLMELTRYATRKAISLYESLGQIGAIKKVTDNTRKKVEWLMAIIRKHSAITKEKSVKEVVLQFLYDFKFNEYLLAHEEHKKFVHLRAFVKKMDSFISSSDDPTVVNFSKFVDYERQSGDAGDMPVELEDGSESVRVMTIHSAKGLEFSHVFVVNLADKRFPSMSRHDPIELPEELVKEVIPEGDVHLQEERRLFYVALTRAKRGIYLSSAYNYGGKTRKKLSRFIYEAGLRDKREDVSEKPRKKKEEKGLEFAPSFVNRVAKNEKDNKSKLKLPLPRQFSFSQIRAFETCPYQYYLNFILKIPTGGKGQFSFGRTMHNTLERFMSACVVGQAGDQVSMFENVNKPDRVNSLPDIKDLYKIYEEAWIDDWFDNKNDKIKYYNKGKRILGEYHELLKKRIPQVLALEKDFTFKVNGYTIKGTIDRVDILPDGRVEIVDYKTGSPKDKLAKDDKDQLLMYQIAAEEVFGWQVEKLTFHYLDNHSKISFVGSEKEIEKIKNKITDLIEGIVQYDFEATPNQHVCKYCDFNKVCSYREI